MSKIMKMIRYFSVAALASLLAHSVWAAITPTAYTEASGYQKFSYSKIINWRGDGATFHNQKVTELQADGTEGAQYSQTANNNDKSWQRFAENQTGFTNHASPVGLVLRLDSTTATKQIDAQFAPFNMGGLIVEAEGYSFVSNNNDARGTLFGDTSGSTETYMEIKKSVTFTRGGSDNSNTKPNTFYGTVNLFIAEGAVFNFNADNTKAAHKVFMKGSKNSATGGCLKMSGAGQLKLKTLNAEGNTLDYSALSLDRTTAFIVGNLVVNAETKYAFPAGLTANTPFKLCSGTITKNGVDVATTIRVGSEQKKVNLTFDTANGTVSYALEAASWKPNTANTAAITDGILDWTATGAWLDAEGNATTWPTGKNVEDGLSISAVIDAKHVAGVKISGQVKAKNVAVECSDNMSHEFQFHNHTLGVEGTTTTDDTVDCLTATIINFADFGGELGLKVPISGSINFSSATHLVFKTGEAQGAASTAYGYTIVGNASAIEVSGEGKFKVPAGMYGVSFAPASTATIVYDVAEEATVSTTFGGTGTIMKTGAGTLTLTTNLPAGITLTAAEGTLKFGSATQYGSAAATVNVLKGATFVSNRECDSWHYNTSGIVFNIYGTLDMANTRINVNNGQTWNIYAGAEIKGAGQGNYRALDFADASGDPEFKCHADPTGESTEIKWNVTGRIRGRNPIFNIDAGVTVILNNRQYLYSNGLTLTKKGLGTLKLTTDGVIESNVIVEAGVLDLTGLTDGSAVLKGNLTIGENGIVKFPDGEFVACAGALAGITSSVISDGNGGLVKVTVDGATVSTEVVATPTAFDKQAGYWQNIFVGPAEGADANASELNQWIAPTGTSLPPLASNSDRWQPALFDGTLMVNVEEDGYKNIPATKWEGWQLQVGLVNGAKVTVAELVKIQDTQGVGCFIGVDSTSKLVVSKFNNGSHNGTIDFDIAAPEGLVVANEMRGNNPNYLYVFRGNGSIKVDGAFNSGASHKVKYVELSADEIGKDTTKTQYKVRKYRKLIGFTSTTLTADKVSFASDATVKVGDGEPSTALVRGNGEELNALDADGTAKIVINPDGMAPGIYVQYIGYSETRPAQYQWVFDPNGDTTDTTDNWSGEKNWKGIVANGRRTTWNDNQEWTNDTTKDPHWTPETDASYNDYINYANDITFYFDANVQQTVTVDYSVAATLADAWVAGSGVKDPSKERQYSESHRLIKLVNTADAAGEFKFNLPNPKKGDTEDGLSDLVDDEGAPLKGFDFNAQGVAEVSAPIDATGFNGEIGLRAKLTGPITLGPNAKVVFVKPAIGGTTIAYDYNISGAGVIEVRGGGEFIVPNNMVSSVPFEITADPKEDNKGAGYIVYNVESGTVTVNAAITGAGGVKKTGAGTLILAGECSFEGALEVLEGTVEMAAHDDNTRISAINVSSGATLTIKLTPEQKQTGYNATNVHNSGTFKVVDADGAELSFLNGTQIVPGTEKIWKQGVINSDFITSTPMAILYGVRLSEIIPSGAYGAIVGKLSGNYINNNVASQAIDATGTISGDTTMTVNDKEYAAKTLKIQATDGGVLKTHEIKICEIQDNAEGGLWKIWAQSVNTYNDQGNSYGADGVSYRAIMIWAKATQTLATIPGGYNYPTLTAAISAAASGSTEAARTITLVGACGEDITIPEGVTVDTNGQTFTGTVTGAGKIVFTAVPTVAALTTSLQQDTWTGTVVLSQVQLVASNNTLNGLGNAKSKIELDNCRGYFRNSHTYTVEIVLTGIMTQDNGYSGHWTVFKKLSGTGKILSKGQPTQNLFIEDSSEFSGDIETTSESIYFGTDDGTHNRVGTIVVGVDAAVTITEGQVWSASNGVLINGTLDLRLANSAAFVAGDMTVSETASIRFPTDWKENVGLPLCTGTLTAADSETAVPIMVGDYAFKAKLRFDPATKSVSYRCDSSVTPVALWKGDFNTTTKNGITLNANGNTIANDEAGSSVTIGETATKGLSFTIDNGVSGIAGPATVLVKYSLFEVPTANAVMFSFGNTLYPKDLIGGYVNSSGKLGTIWNDGTYASGSVEGSPSKNGMLAVSASFAVINNGAIVYIKDETSADFEIGRDAHGVYASGQQMKCFSIGGPVSSPSLKALPGMKIEAVAVFNDILTPDEMNTYDWGFDGEDPTMTWNGEDGADIGTLSNWTTDSSDPSFEDFDLLFPSTVDEEVKGLTVSAGFTTSVAAKIEGAYKLTSGTLNMSSLSFGANGSLRIEKGAKIKLEGFSKALLSKITFAGGSLTVKEAQRFTSDDVLNIADVSELPAGAYELLMWEGHPNSGTSGYGRPATPVITGVKTDWEAKLVYQTHGIVLLLRDPEWLARPALTIWPFGDSITEGMNNYQTHANYRIQLYQKLQLLGYNVKSVGFSTRTWGQRGAYDPSGVDISAEEDWIRHSGVGGELAVHYTPNHGTLHDSWANALDQAGDPDIVLIHIGINDITGDASNGSDNARWRETYGSVTNMAANILRERPNTKVVLSSMNRLEKGQQFQGNGNANYVMPFRDAMVALMTKVKAGEIAALPADRVFFADMYDKIRPRSYDNFQEGEKEENGLFEGDHIHPNWEGHHRMSDCWLEQVLAAFPDPEDKAEVFHSRGTPKDVPAEKLGAEKNVPEAYLNGFTKATVITPAENGMERANTVTINKIVADTTAISKVGYYVEYVFPSATTNIHRWVWVDMDAIKDGMTVGEAGLPTKTIQQVVNKLHVASNHLAIHPVDADDDSVKGFIEFSPESFGGNGNVAGGPAHWMNNTSWNDAFNGGAYGSMQIHRMAPGANPYDPGSTPPAEVLFAYNAWNCGNDGKPTEFGIGDFNQHLTGFTTDWVNMRNTETMHSGCLKAKSIEIWVKPVAIESVDVKPTEEGIAVAKPAGAESVVVETSEGETVSDNTIPLTATGLYTIKAKVGDKVVATEQIGVIAAKDAEESSETKVTTAVAVPFEGATVANLLNTALLSDGDTLMAYIGGKYEKWTLGEDKSWSYTKIERVGGEEDEDLPATTTLARGTAVWVMTAGKIVVLGKYNESAAIVAPTAKETHLLANPTMEAYTPSAAAANDEVIIIGEQVDKDVTTVRYAKSADGWKRHTFKKVSNPFGGSAIGSKEVIDDAAPSVPVGKGFWFIKK